MDVRAVTSWQALSELRAQWNRLAESHPMRSWEWLATWWKHYGQSEPDHELFVLAVYTTDDRSNEKLVGIAPWFIRKTLTSGKVIEFLGEEEVCTDHLTILSQENSREDVSDALASYLSNEMTSWDVMHLDHVDENDAGVFSLIASLSNHGLSQFQKMPVLQSWKIDLPDSWEEYVSRLSKSHRTQTRRIFRKMKENFTAKSIVATTQEEFKKFWPIFMELHQKRWELRGEPGCFASAKFEAMHTEVAKLFLESGHLQLLVTTVNGQYAAAEYSFTSDTTVHLYQSGLDPDLLSYEPGRISMIHAIQKAIEEGKQTFDFLRGNEPYKPHWRATPVPAWSLRIVNRHATAQLRDAGWRTAQKAKMLIKAGISHAKQTSFFSKGDAK